MIRLRTLSIITVPALIAGLAALLAACGGQSAPTGPAAGSAATAPAASAAVGRAATAPVAPAAAVPAVTAPAAPDAASTHAGMVQGTVWVANEYGNSISAIDANTNTVITTLTGVEGPHNLQVAPDGKSVWAVSGHESLALMIDPASYQLHGTVPTGKEPAHIILTPDGKTAYATNGDDDTVTAMSLR